MRICYTTHDKSKAALTHFQLVYSLLLKGVVISCGDIHELDLGGPSQSNLAECGTCD